MIITIIDLNKDKDYEKSDCYLFKKNGSKITFQEKFDNLKQSASKRKIDKWIISLPLNIAGIRIVKRPFNERNKILETIPQELQEMILDNVQKIVFDIEIKEEQKGRVLVKILFLNGEDLKNIITYLKILGISAYKISSAHFIDNSNGFTYSNCEDPDVRLMANLIISPVNLLNDNSYMESNVSTFKNRTLVFKICLFILLSSALILGGYKIEKSNEQGGILTNEIKQLYKSTFPQEKIISELYQMNAHLKTIQDKEKFISPMHVLNLLLAFSNLNKEEVIFDKINISKEIIILKGKSPDVKSVEDIINKLKTILTDIQLQRSEQDEGNKYSFVIQAKKEDK